MRSDNVAGVMAYLTELDDLRSHIVYPPRGMEFEPVEPASTPEQIPREEKSMWHQEELCFAFDPANPRPSA